MTARQLTTTIILLSTLHISLYILYNVYTVYTVYRKNVS